MSKVAQKKIEGPPYYCFCKDKDGKKIECTPKTVQPGNPEYPLNPNEGREFIACDNPERTRNPETNQWENGCRFFKFLDGEPSRKPKRPRPNSDAFTAPVSQSLQRLQALEERVEKLESLIANVLK